MNTLIYIEISEKINPSYEKEKISLIRSWFPDIQVFDLDNHSDPGLFDHIPRLTDTSERTVLLISLKDDTRSARLTGIIEKIKKYRDKVLVILQGENPALENTLGKYFGDNFLKKPSAEEEKNRIKYFLD